MTILEIIARTELANKNFVAEQKKENEADWLDDYYSNSVGQSVVNDFESGNVKTVILK